MLRSDVDEESARGRQQRRTALLIVLEDSARSCVLAGRSEQKPEEVVATS